MKSYTLLACALACMTILHTNAQSIEDTTTAPSSLGPFPIFSHIKLRQQHSWAVEITCAIFVAVSLYAMIVGRRKNHALALQYVAEMVGRPDRALVRNFAEIEPQIIQEGPSLFKFYVTGRRFCQGMLINFRMSSRHDIVSKFMNSNQRDVCDIEINMNEAAMPLSVLFIGSQSSAKTVPLENRDISALTKRFEPTKDRLAGWPTDDLVVQVEHSSTFYEVISPQVMEAFFGSNTFNEVARYFRYLHASDCFRVEGWKVPEGPGTLEKRPVVRLSFYLPGTNNWDIVEKFINLACMAMDGLGACKLMAEQVKKAQDARNKAEASREDSVSEKERKLEERRLQKEREERERLARLPPEQREKERAKREKVLRDRRMRSMAKKF